MPVRVTSKGQVTIPKPVRERLGIKTGTEVAFEIGSDGRAYLRRAGKRETVRSRFKRLRGSAAGHLTTDQIMALTRGDR